MSEQITFSEWVKRRRKELDLTQQELANRVGCSVMSIRKFENNSRRPSKQVAELLARALDIEEDRNKFLALARHTNFPNANQKHTNLPSQLSPFIGRQKELENILNHISNPDCRLLTLVGAGGMGKTRLAMQAAEMLQSEFADGVYLVPLASLQSTDFIIFAIAKAVGFRFFEQGDPQAQLFDYLREKQLLLVMDNFEHLIDGSPLLTHMLASAPKLKIMITSWEFLSLHEEWIIHVEGLAFPRIASDDEMLKDSVEDFDAVQLFTHLAKHLKPEFSIRVHLRSVIQICQQISGMPLAIELAASWLSTISCEQIASQIVQDIDFLRLQSKRDHDRHLSLRAIFDRSWNFLGEEEQAVFMKLSVFRGDFSLEAAQTIGCASLLNLKSLVEKSLIRIHPEGRYSIHEFLRQYAFQKLQTSGEITQTRARFVNLYVTLAKNAEIFLKTPDRMHWVKKLNLELDHLRTIREWGKADKAYLDDEITLLASLWVYWSWYFRDIADTARWCDDIIQRTESLNGIKSLMGFYTIGSITYSQGRYEYGQGIVTEGAKICRQRNDRRSLGFILTAKGIALLSVDKPTAALPVLEESLAILSEQKEEWFLPITLAGLALVLLVLRDIAGSETTFSKALDIAEKHGHAWEIGIVLYFASHNSLAQGNYARARKQIERAIELQQDTDHLWSLANLLNALGHILRLEHNLEGSETAFTESLELYRLLGNRRNVANLLISLGKLAFLQQRGEKCRAFIIEGLSVCQKIENTSGIRNCLTALADYLISDGRFKDAAYLLGNAESLSDPLYDPLHAHQLFEIPYDYSISRDVIEKAGFIEAWHKGSKLSTEQVIQKVRP